MIATLFMPYMSAARLRGPGLYVARHESRDLFTLGKADRSTIADRLKRHAVRYDGPDFEYERHRFHPFTELAFAITFEQHRSLDIELAEHALYAAVAVEYEFVSTSVFTAPREEQLEPIRERLFDYLQAYGNVAGHFDKVA